jgi:hypothetical protein
MNVTSLKLAGVQREKGDVLLGARMRVCDDDSGLSFHEGTVVAVEQMFGPMGEGECLRLMVDRRVVGQKEEAVANSKVVVVDLSIQMDRVRLQMNSGQKQKGVFN